MALAVLTHEGDDGRNQAFRIDIGSNRYYAWAVGHGRARGHAGVAMLKERAHASPLLGPLPREANGRAVLDIPADAFSRDDHSVQLLSFRTEQLAGPAISDIVDVIPTRPVAGQMSAALPAAARPAMSQGMFFAALADAVGRVLPQIIPIAGQVVGSLFRPSQGGATGGGGQPAPGSNEALLLDFLRQLVAQVGAAPGAAAGAPSTPPAPGPAPATAGAPATPPNPATGAPSSGAPVRARSLAMSGYSTAQVFPLLAALPALAPILQQVLTPQTIQGVLQTADPNRLIGTVSNAIGDFARIGLQANEQLMSHLRALNPGLGDETAIRLLEGMSVAQGGPTPASMPKFRRVTAAQLEFLDLQPVDIGGRSVVAFRNDRDVVIRLAVKTPRPIGDATALVIVRRAESRRQVAAARVELHGVVEGKLGGEVRIPKDATAKLTPGDYLFCAALIWKTGKGEPIGIVRTQLASIVPESTFVRLEGTGTPQALNDVEAHRAWWHKVWQISWSDRTRRAELAVRYRYDFEPERVDTLRLPTTVDASTPPDRREMVGKLQAGMACGPLALAELGKALGLPALRQDQLHALAGTAFKAAFERQARTNVTFKGRPNETAALWVYPEVVTGSVILRRATGVGEDGQVTKLETETIKVPIPTVVHVVGTESQ